jgi:hypothetical protein
MYMYQGMYESWTYSHKTYKMLIFLFAGEILNCTWFAWHSAYEIQQSTGSPLTLLNIPLVSPHSPYSTFHWFLTHLTQHSLIPDITT